MGRRLRGGEVGATCGALLVAFALACSDPGPAPGSAAAPQAAASDAMAPATPRGDVLWTSIGGETFILELALDPKTRYRGLGGRTSIPRNGGMFFAFPRSRPLAMVMRDCPVAIDVAFLDGTGRVVALHAMPPEPPRGPGESAAGYESRLPAYRSATPVQFAVETAGGRLAELAVEVGQRIAFDASALLSRVR